MGDRRSFPATLPDCGVWQILIPRPGPASGAELQGRKRSACPFLMAPTTALAVAVTPLKPGVTKSLSRTRGMF